MCKLTLNTALLTGNCGGKYTPVHIRSSELREDIEFQLTGVIKLNFPHSPGKAEDHGDKTRCLHPHTPQASLANLTAT